MLADGYERVLDDALRPARALTASVPVQRELVREAVPEIEALVARLRDVDRPIDRDALWEAHELLCDGSGPLYVWAEPGTVRRRVRLISEAME